MIVVDVLDDWTKTVTRTPKKIDAERTKTFNGSLPLRLTMFQIFVKTVSMLFLPIITPTTGLFKSSESAKKAKKQTID